MLTRRIIIKKYFPLSVDTYTHGLAGLPIIRDREMMQEHIMIDRDQLIGVNVQEKAVEGALEAKPLHTFTTVIHEEDGSWNSTHHYNKLRK